MSNRQRPLRTTRQQAHIATTSQALTLLEDRARRMIAERAAVSRVGGYLARPRVTVRDPRWESVLADLRAGLVRVVAGRIEVAV
jgi:hypothetical protein